MQLIEIQQQTYMKPFKVQNESIANGLDLGRDNWQHWGIDSIELIKAAPSSTLGKSREDLTNSLHKGKENKGKSWRQMENWAFK